jgi:hypothetical protein
MNMKNVVGVVQRILAVALLTSALSATAYATSFTGTIAETIKSTDNPNFYVGQTVMGTYAYDSPSVDGTFGTLFYDQNALPLVGSVFLFIGPSEGWIGIGTMRDPADPFTWPQRGITVDGGQVTSFFLQGQSGFLDFGFSSSFFSVYSPVPNHFGDTYHTVGTISFSDPVSVAEPSALILLGLGLSGLIAVRSIRGYPSLKSRIQS